MQGNIIKIFHTKYDGYYVVKTTKQIYAYEGEALCPEPIKERIKKGEAEEISKFWHEIQ